jgi:DNA-binding transcriptional MerR regulator
MLTIGKAAKRVGVSASAIRYYERRGLLQPSRLLNGYRVYDEDAVKALRFVRQAGSVGITLREIRGLLEIVRDGGRPCEGMRELAHRRLSEIDVKMRQLRSLRTELRRLLSHRVPTGSDDLCPLVSFRRN